MTETSGKYGINLETIEPKIIRSFLFKTAEYKLISKKPREIISHICNPSGDVHAI